MHPSKKILFLLLFATQWLFSQKEKQATTLEKTVTTLYEISYDKATFDIYPLDKKGLILFFKLANDDDFLDCIKLTTENLEQYKTMDLTYYASIVKTNIEQQFTILESKFVENKEKSSSYHLLIYEKMIGNNSVKIYQRIYFNNGFGFSISLRTVKSKFDDLLLNSAEIINSFKIMN